MSFRILAVHNRYLIRGGEDECYLAELRLLRENGHQVEEYVEDNQRVAALGAIRTALRTVWSQEAYRQIRVRIRKTKPDIVYVQNFFPLISPAVYYAATAERVPVVQTLHNYRLLCPNALLLRDGKVCEACLSKPVAWPAVRHACYRKSRAASGAVVSMLGVHRFMQTWSAQVGIYVALTEFARQKFIQGGLPANRIMVKPNFLSPDPGYGEGKGNYALFVGRLSQEKGLDVLLAAWQQLGDCRPLKVVGDGPLAAQMAMLARRQTNIEWLGRQSAAQVLALMKNALFLVFPSICYEGLPRVIVEAFAVGLPVIASDLGGMASLVEHQRTGLHFCAGEPAHLQQQVRWALEHPHELRSMRAAARAEFEARYTEQQNYRTLMQIFEAAAHQWTHKNRWRAPSKT